MRNVFYLIPISIDMANCFSIKKSDHDVNNIHFWNNKYSHPEETVPNVIWK